MPINVDRICHYLNIRRDDFDLAISARVSGTFTLPGRDQKIPVRVYKTE